MPSFTQRLPNLQQLGPLIEIMLTPSVPFVQTFGLNTPVGNVIKMPAMIDTGASGTVIGEGLAQSLGINPVETALMNTPSSANVPCLQFDVQLVFPNNVIIQSITVTEAPLENQHVRQFFYAVILRFNDQST